MKSLFLKMYLVITSVVIFGLVALYILSLESYSKEAARDEIRYSSRPHQHLLKAIEGQPTSAYEDIVAQRQLQISYNLSLLSLGEIVLSDEKKHTLESGSPVGELNYLEGGESWDVYWPFPGDQYIRYRREYNTEDSDRRISTILMLLLVVAIPLTVFFLVRPITRSLLTISHYLHLFAAGDLEHRVKIKGPKAFDQVGEDLQKMADGLRKKIQEQMVMTHAISHELKTPLTRLRMENDLAKMSDSLPDLELYVTNVDEELTHLESLITSILTLAKFTHQQKDLPLEKVDLHGYLNQVLEKIKDPYKTVTVSLDNIGCVTQNPEGLIHVLNNLLGNAIRYASSQVNIHGYQSGTHYFLSIEDDGPGIPEDQYDSVFLPFSRVDHSRSRDTGGTGLGLAIVLTILERSRSKIVIGKSDLGGVKFTVQLTVADSSLLSVTEE